jgi:hypothetical protein
MSAVNKLKTTYYKCKLTSQVRSAVGIIKGTHEQYLTEKEPVHLG